MSKQPYFLNRAFEGSATYLSRRSRSRSSLTTLAHAINIIHSSGDEFSNSRGFVPHNSPSLAALIMLESSTNSSKTPSAGPMYQRYLNTQRPQE